MVQLISHIKSANYIDGIGINIKAYLSLQRKTWVPSPHGFLNSPQISLVNASVSEKGEGGLRYGNECLPISLSICNQDGGHPFVNPSALGFVLFSLVLFD